MLLQLFFKLAQNISVIVTISFLLSKTRIFKKAMKLKNNLWEKLLLISVFSAIGIMGTYTGVSIKGALANSRVVGVVVGALIGGPVVGIGAGIIAGLHRYLIGGFTAAACGLATVAEACTAAWYARKRSSKDFSWKFGLIIGVLTETLQMLIILAIARPFSAAWDLVSAIGLPMIVMNSVGIAIFVVIARNSLEEEERAGALQAQKALEIAKITLPILSKGLDEYTAKQVAQLIYDRVEVEAVALTNKEVILAHVGNGCSHHLVGTPIMTEATKEALNAGEMKLALDKEQIGCPNKDCTLRSAVIVPLFSRGAVSGSLKLYQDRERGIGSVEIQLAQGLAGLFSTQLELAVLEEQAKLISKAELKALQAQINPHFLFNALNTIVALVRTDGEKARKLLIQLGEFFRKNIQRGDKFVTLRQELEHIRAYLTIEQARFGDNLKVVENIQAEAEDWQLPALTLQPLVENAIKHGIYPKIEGGTVDISCWVEDNALRVVISDDGVGIEAERLEEIYQKKGNSSQGMGLGLSNVNDRLKYLYGSGLLIESEQGKGTRILFSIPS
ncbi:MULTISPECIES: sensor histidine kinase [Desulfosporosinus]|uniref:histidine kinase n=1 Tax=Desulfosporosinus acididurans TaxID=476652 RepID=A0A0J1FU45_9FIRM|nr:MULTISPECIES: sensor histidine kinase [Desulfosporosinus]KLU66974.1 sensor histidine kinase YpdA [Desulfosporosinus acididurans]